MKLTIDIDLTTDSREQIAMVANLLNTVTNASRRPSASAQPEVASNTGSEGSGFSLSPSDLAVTGEAIPAAEAAPEASPVVVKDAGGKDAVKRTRRTKAEMEAAVEPVEKSSPVVESETQPTSTPAAQPTTAEPAATAGPSVATLDDVRAALQAFTADKGVPAGIELLKEFGAARISELKSEHYGAFIAKCGNV